MSEEKAIPAAGDASAAQTSIDDKVPVSQKIAYGLGSANDMFGNWLYPSMIYPVFNIFLLVSPKMVGLVLMVNRLFDALSDPFFAWMSDNARTRWGRRRPFILIGSILSGLLFPTLFLVGRDWSESSYVWYMIISSGILITAVSCFNMPWASLGAELTPGYNERTSVYSYKAIIQKIPEMGLFFAAAFISLKIFNDATGKPDMLTGARVYSVIIGAIMILVGIIVFSVVKERYYDKVVSQKKQDISFADTIWKALKCKPFRAQLSMALAYGLGTSMVGTLGYYATVYYVCQGDVSLGSKWNFGMGLAGMGFAVAGVPIFAALANRFGKRITMIVVQVIAILVYMATWVLYDPDIKWLQLFASGGIGFIGAGFWMLYGSMLADVVDYDEMETGKRREGAFNACGSWIMKVGMAVGIGLSGVILESTGFDASLEAAQSTEALNSIRFYLMSIPIVGLIISLVAVIRFPLSREVMADIRKKLEATRGKV